MKRGLIVFARHPLPGHVKTRLAAVIGDLAAAELYRAMLEDVLAMVAGLEGIRPLVFWATDCCPPAAPTGELFESFVQSGATLGERMANAFETAFRNGIRSCCIIGSDSPDLLPHYIHQAFQELELDRSDVVFGPAEDGGYYLLGMGRFWRRLFEDVSWSGPQVLETSLERARELGLRTFLLPAWYDLDRMVDLGRLAASTGQAAPRTRAALRRVNTLFTSAQSTGES